MKVLSVGSTYHVINVVDSSVESIKAQLASRLGLEADEVLLIQSGRAVVNDKDLVNTGKIYALCKYSCVRKSDKIVHIVLKGQKMELAL